MADPTTFEDIAMPHLDAVHRAAVAICGNRDEASDLVQTTFAKALERFGSFRPGTNCKAWLMTILRNTWIDDLRRRKTAGTQLPLVEEIVASPPPVEQAVWTDASDILENFADEDVIRALGELPDEQRLTLFLMDVEGLPHEDVAVITDVAVGTVKSRTSRARALLKDRLLEHAKAAGLVGRRS
jgi:RNA polymerase sigma-70 factor (ECF subfamily)